MEQSRVSKLSQFKLLSWEVCGSKPNSWTLDFIKTLTQIKNEISKVQQFFKYKNAEIVNVLQ